MSVEQILNSAQSRQLQILESLSSVSKFDHESLLPTDFQCRSQDFQNRHWSCGLCQNLTQMLRLYEYKFGDPFEFKAGPLQGQKFRIVRSPAQPMVEDIPYPSQTLTAMTASLKDVAVDPLKPYVRAKYLQVDPFTLKVINNWIAEQQLPPNKVRRIPMAGFCGDYGVMVEEVTQPISTLSPAEIPLALGSIAKILDQGRKIGLTLGSGEFRVRELPGEFELKLVNPGGVSYKSRKGWVRLQQKQHVSRYPIQTTFELSDASGESGCWFQLELPLGAEIPELGVPPVQSALNFYRVLSKISGTDSFEEAVKDPDFEAKIKDLTRGEPPQGILKKPMRCDVIQRVLNW